MHFFVFSLKKLLSKVKNLSYIFAGAVAGFLALCLMNTPEYFLNTQPLELNPDNIRLEFKAAVTIWGAIMGSSIPVFKHVQNELLNRY